MRPHLFSMIEFCLHCGWISTLWGHRGISFPLQGNSHQNGRAASPRPPLLDTPRRTTSFFMRRFILVMGLMPFGHGAFSFRHGAFCRHTGRGSVPAARFVVAPPIFLLSSYADRVRLKFRGGQQLQIASILPPSRP